MTTLRDLLSEVRIALEPQGSGSLDALLLLEWASGISRANLMAELATATEKLFATDVVERFHEAVSRRATGCPVAYITGYREFYEDRFQVGPGVLIPRPDTEVLVERAIEVALEEAGGTVFLHDCCSGSGCIGISVARELARHSRNVRLTLSDVDAEALQWTFRNAATLLESTQIDWDVRRHSLLGGRRSPDPPREGDRYPVTIVTANPPYLTQEETEQALQTGWGEPAQALAAGDDGLSVIRPLVLEAITYLPPGGYLMVEHGWNQGEAVAALCKSAGFTDIHIRKDLAGHNRFVEARSPDKTGW